MKSSMNQSVNQKIPVQHTVTIAREEERGGNEDKLNPVCHYQAHGYR